MSDDLVFCLPIEKAQNKPFVSGDFFLSSFTSFRWNFHEIFFPLQQKEAAAEEYT